MGTAANVGILNSSYIAIESVCAIYNMQSRESQEFNGFTRYARALPPP